MKTLYLLLISGIISGVAAAGPAQRERIKRSNVQQRRLQHRLRAA
jgi:hypothetical protein